MNYVSTLFMSLLTSRLTMQIRDKLLERQVALRHKYSKVDNLNCIIQLKFNQGKKVYAFFVILKQHLTERLSFTSCPT